MSITIPSKYPKRKATCFRLGFAYHELDHTILIIIDLIDMSFRLTVIRRKALYINNNSYIPWDLASRQM